MATKNHNQDFQSDDLPQEITESYGTGIKYFPGYNVGESLSSENTESSPEFPVEFTIARDDIDTYWQDTVGDEAVGGTVSIPDQNVTEDIEAAVGLEMSDYAFLRTNDILNHRDNERWELDPKSSEDYPERKE